MGRLTGHECSAVPSPPSSTLTANLSHTLQGMNTQSRHLTPNPTLSIDSIDFKNSNVCFWWRVLVLCEVMVLGISSLLFHSHLWQSISPSRSALPPLYAGRSFPPLSTPLASRNSVSSAQVVCRGLCVSSEVVWFAVLAREDVLRGGAGCSKHRRMQLQRSGSSRASNAWQESQLKEAFDLMDRDGDGTIKAEDLSYFLQYSLKSELSEDDIATMISLADRDGNGAVDFEEFLSLVQSHVPQRSENLSSLGNEALAEMFRVLDRNGDGVLCSDDLSGVMGELGQALSSEDLLAMLETATGSDRRQVTFEDFCLLMSAAGAQ